MIDATGADIIRAFVDNGLTVAEGETGWGVVIVALLLLGGATGALLISERRRWEAAESADPID